MMTEFRYKLACKGYLVLEDETKGQEENSDYSLLQIFLSFASLGFKINKESLLKLKYLSTEALTAFYQNSFKVLQNVKGDDVKHIVFYKNFPNLENMTELDYYINAFLHYLTASSESYGYMPQEESKEKSIESFCRLDEISVVTKDEGIKILAQYFTNLLEGKKAISVDDFRLLKLFIRKYPNVVRPTAIPFKENMAEYLYIFLSEDKDEKIGNMLEKIDTSFVVTLTDILRLYAIISEDTADLIYNIRFASLDRKARKFFVSKIDALAKENPNIIDDAARHEFLWKRAFEKLHIGEYYKTYPAAYDVAKKIRSGKYSTYNANVQKAIAEKNTVALCNLLMIKPGMFARTLDFILRNEDLDCDLIITSFEKVAHDISTPVLIGLWEYFQNRNDLADNRNVMFRKGTRYVFNIVNEVRNKANEGIVDRVISIIEKNLTDIFAKKDFVGKVYLDECMKKYMIPLNNVNASSGFHTLAFGSRIQIKEKDSVLRFFSHWKNNEDYSVDLDISVEFFDKDFLFRRSVSWHHMDGGSEMKAYHSGDIVTAPEGASEFIDIDVNAALKLGLKYAVISNVIYSGQAFATIPECFSGVMVRSQIGKKGEIFDAKTVAMKFDLTQKDTRMTYSLAVDLETFELIWLDIPDNKQGFYMTAAGNANIISVLLKKVTQRKMSLYDLVKLHSGCIEFVDSKEEADFIIDDSDNSYLSPYKLDEISKKWL